MGKRVAWYRCPVPRERLKELNRKSDALGFAQTLGFLAVLAAASGAAIYSSLHWPWYVTALLVLVNGHFWHFIVNGFHELIHDSVFRTRWLNRLFLRIYSFIGWYNHHVFWASHTAHHKYTLHPPADREVEIPGSFDLQDFWKSGIVDLRYVPAVLKGYARTVRGYVGPAGSWIADLFPPSAPERRRARRNWDRIVLFGHLAIAAAALANGLWVVPLVITFPRAFGGWLQRLCNATQHIGLQDNVPDYRLCCRTIYLSPVLQFLYWHMNYHTEHHMYAAVPCYRLGRLHRLIRRDMPRCTRGLRETWTQIARILERQAREPDYRFVPELPAAASVPATAPAREREAAAGIA